MSMRLFHKKFSLKTLLLAITGFCILIGFSRSAYIHDQARVRSLGKAFLDIKLGKRYQWNTAPDVLAFYEWIGPEILEKPMRQFEIPWFDRITQIVVIKDDHVTQEMANALADSKYLKKIIIRTRDARHTKYKDLKEASAGRIDIEILLVNHS